jgi:hypothetical protein
MENKMSVDPKLVHELKEDSVMLGRIASLVSEFCEYEETTLQGVAKLLALYREYQAKDAWDLVEILEKEEKR